MGIFVSMMEQRETTEELKGSKACVMERGFEPLKARKVRNRGYGTSSCGQNDKTFYHGSHEFSRMFWASARLVLQG